MKATTRRLDPLAGKTVPADYTLFSVMLLLVGLGLWMVFDASYARASQQGLTGANPWFFFKQQACYAAAGLVALLVAMKLPYWKLIRIGPHLMGISAVLLLLVWFPHIGVHSHGAARWLKLGPVRFQPSEMAKLCCVIYLAGYLARKQRAIKTLRPKGLLGALVPVAIMAALIIKEPDLGTAMVLTGTALVMLAVGGARIRHLVAFAGAGLMLVSVIALSHPYSRARLSSFLGGASTDKTYSYQVSQSVAALEAGGPHGAGPGQGDAKFFHLPAPYTDFIATTLGEEFGFIGSFCLLGLFFCFSMRGYHIAHRCPNSFGALLAAGLCTMITLQALLNLAVITRSVPDTGVPLPMISFGGTSLVLVMLATGLILSVSRWPDLRHLDALVSLPHGRQNDDLSRTQVHGGEAELNWGVGQ